MNYNTIEHKRFLPPKMVSRKSSFNMKYLDIATVDQLLHNLTLLIILLLIKSFI
jgi:hypothetical protein